MEAITGLSDRSSGLKDPQRLVAVQSRKDLLEIVRGEAHSPDQDFGHHLSIVRCHGQILAFEQGRLIEAREFTVELSAIDRPAHGQHYVAVAMVGSVRLVASDLSSEFAEHNHVDATHQVTLR